MSLKEEFAIGKDVAIKDRGDGEYLKSGVSSVKNGNAVSVSLGRYDISGKQGTIVSHDAGGCSGFLGVEINIADTPVMFEVPFGECELL